MQSQPPYLRARRPIHQPIPPILITDHTRSPPITTHYHLGANTLSFQPIYTLTKSLLTHPPCPHSPLWPCPSCSTTFLGTYWTVAAHLLDYFADFAHHDSSLMLSLWFHLLDTWQETSSYFPCAEVLRASDVGMQSVQRFTAARWFLEEFRGTMGMVDMLVYGWGQRKGRDGMGAREKIVHVPSGDVCGPAGEYNTGPYISGLRGWEEWLCVGGPGVALPSLDSLYQDSSLENGSGDGGGITRHVPLPTLALIHTHTTRARHLAAHINDLNDPNNTEFLLQFDQNSLYFPTAPTAAQTHTYTSKLTGRNVTYQLVNGTPPVVRYPGYGDPTMLCSRQDFNLLDECVGVCRGVDAYMPVSGEAREEEDGDGDGDSDGENEDYEEEAFDVWSVYETKGEAGRKWVEGWGEMFDNWVEGEEF
jgi:hypothetical protein